MFPSKAIEKKMWKCVQANHLGGGALKKIGANNSRRNIASSHLSMLHSEMIRQKKRERLAAIFQSATDYQRWAQHFDLITYCEGSTDCCFFLTYKTVACETMEITGGI